MAVLRQSACGQDEEKLRPLRRWLAGLVGSVLPSLIDLISILYVVLVLCIQLRSSTIATLQWQYQLSLLVPLTLALLLLEVVAKVVEEGSSFFLKANFQLVDALVLCLALLVEIVSLITHRRAPPWIEFTAIVFRALRITLSARVDEPAESSSLQLHIGSLRRVRGRRKQRFSARKLVYTLGLVKVTFGAALILQGMMLECEVQKMVFLDIPLRDQAAGMLVIRNCAFYLTRLNLADRMGPDLSRHWNGSLIGAHLSSSKEMTLQLMALSTILTTVLAFVFQPRVGARSPRSGEWGDSMSLGHKVHFDANLVDSDVVVSDWRRSFSGFKQAWDRCDGQVYNTSYASPLCEKLEKGRVALLCNVNDSESRHVDELLVDWSPWKHFRVDASDLGLLLSTLCLAGSAEQERISAL
ncbi:MAG: hypothetical protein SGPRY_011063 [Prymnesium sp.]